MQGIKRIIKLTLAFCLHYSGILFLYARLRMRDQLLVLTYHRVLHDSEIARTWSHPGIVVRTESFDAQMDFLKRHYPPVDAAQPTQWRPAGSTRSLITFDDGWRDNFLNALPVLQHKGISALLFVATDYVNGDRPFWQERLGGLLGTILEQDPTDSQLPDAIPRTLLDAPDIWNAVHAVIEHFRAAPYTEIEAVITDLERSRLTPNSGSVDTFLSWEQISRMNLEGVSIGSHSCSHRLLTRLERSEIKEELDRSRATLEDRLGKPVTTLAYPGGALDESVANEARAAGYQYAFTTTPGSVSTQNPMELPRVNVHQGAASSIPLFHCRLLGLL
jgi:peptidoglycan/xylan/chitin deacetylase (PgdA/CDA1 family)